MTMKTPLYCIVKLSTLTLLLLSLGACVLVLPPTNEDTMTTAELISMAQRQDREPVAGEPELVVGYHNGAGVVEAFNCLQDCGSDNFRMIYYQIPERETCDSINGVIKFVTVPNANNLKSQNYCLPKPIVSYWNSYTE